MIRLPPGAYLTSTVANRDFAAARIIETSYEPGQSLPLHAHDHAYLVVMTAGSLVESCGNRQHELRRGQLVFNAAAEPHQDRVGKHGARCLNIELRPSFVARLAAADAMPRQAFAYTHAGAAIAAIGHLWCALRSNDGGAVDDVLIELLSSVDGDQDRQRRCPWLADVLARVMADWRHGAHVEAIAGAIGISPSHLCRAFRAAVGCTIGEFARRLRADAACAQLAGGATSLAAVAATCGFADQSHMTRELGRRYGRSPARLRALASNGA